MSDEQISLFRDEEPIVHFYDRNEALRTGRIMRRITRGRNKGKFVVVDSEGKTYIPDRIRNMEIRPDTEER